eukprot:SM000008S22168  [mRNA]  locus=s8:185057:187834:- [translate_table: standard]
MSVAAAAAAASAALPAGLAPCEARARLRSSSFGGARPSSRSRGRQAESSRATSGLPFLRPSLVAASTQEAAVATPAAAGERAELKEKLASLLEQTNGSLTDESLAVIASLEKLNPNPEPTNLPDLFTGHFQLLNSSMQGVLYRGAIVTLGRATFNAFRPNGLKICMREVYNDVGMARNDQYDVTLPFTIAEQGQPPLDGLIRNRAKYDVASAGRLNVVFESSALEPRHSKDLKAWLELFKEHNSDMDDQGVYEVKLPPAKGWLDLTYLDDDYRITHGNLGTIVVVQRVPEPLV